MTNRKKELLRSAGVTIDTYVVEEAWTPAKPFGGKGLTQYATVLWGMELCLNERPIGVVEQEADNLRRFHVRHRRTRARGDSAATQATFRTQREAIAAILRGMGRGM